MKSKDNIEGAGLHDEKSSQVPTNVIYSFYFLDFPKRKVKYNSDLVFTFVTKVKTKSELYTHNYCFHSTKVLCYENSNYV